MGGPNSGKPLSDEDKALRKVKGAGILTDEEQDNYITLLLSGYRAPLIFRLMRRSNMTVSNTRKNYPEFDQRVKEAKRAAGTTRVEESLETMATGEHQIITEHYVPLLDADKNPVIDKDGKVIVRLASKTVRKPGPSLSAQKFYLKGNDPKKYGTLQKEEGSSAPSEVLSKEELEKLIDEKADKLTTDSSPKV